MAVIKKITYKDGSITNQYVTDDFVIGMSVVKPGPSGAVVNEEIVNLKDQQIFDVSTDGSV